MTSNLILFLVLAFVSVGAALGLLFSRNSVYAALFLILNFITTAVFYILLNAPFLAMAQVSVYAGAIMVLFLFVIMLLGTKEIEKSKTLAWQRPVAFGLGAILLIEIIYLFAVEGEGQIFLQQLTSDFGSPASIGEVLFNQYLLPFEVTSILLLVGMIGAIVLTKRSKN